MSDSTAFLIACIAGVVLGWPAWATGSLLVLAVVNLVGELGSAS